MWWNYGAGVRRLALAIVEIASEIRDLGRCRDIRQVAAGPISRRKRHACHDAIMPLCLPYPAISMQSLCCIIES